MAERVQGQSESWRNHTPDSGGGDPERALLPVFDQVTDPTGPGLVYKAVAGGGAEVIVVEGLNLTGITVADVSRDVKVGGNGGPAPGILSVIVTDTTVTITMDCSLCIPDDYWGVILRPVSGIGYGAPSPLKIFAAPPPP